MPIARRTLIPSDGGHFQTDHRHKRAERRADQIAGRQLADLPVQARRELATFMDAVVIVDPMEYQRSPGEPRKPLRTLYFGHQNQGLVTFLVDPPDDLVLITRIQWLGE